MQNVGTVRRERDVVELYIVFIILGICLGAFGTLVGTGGGFLLVPVLLWVYPDWPPAAITSISLAVVAVNSISGVWAYNRLQRIHYQAGIAFAGAAVPGAMLGAFSTSYIPRGTFDFAIGVLLFVAAVLLFWVSVRRSRTVPDEERATLLLSSAYQMSRRNIIIGSILSGIIAFCSSLLGISGGIFQVPVMVFGLGMPVHIAVATSEFTLAIKGMSAASVHLMQGTLLTTLPQVLVLSVGVAVGAQVGARLSSHIHGDWIMRLVALSIGFIGVSVATTALIP
jgi:hypothetical protein